MKKIILLLLIVPFIGTSCSNEQFYSCDHTIDTWVKNNLDEIKSMDTQTFREFEKTYQLAIFNAIDFQTRIDIWKEKVNMVLKLDWSEAESIHIKQLLTIIDERAKWYFTGAISDNDQKELAVIAYKWADYARNELGWDDKVIGAITASPAYIMDKTGDLVPPTRFVEASIQVKTRSSENGSYSPPACTCNPIVSFCSPCYYLPCTEQSFGCGFLGLGYCNALGC